MLVVRLHASTLASACYAAHLWAILYAEQNDSHTLILHRTVLLESSISLFKSDAHLAFFLRTINQYIANKPS